MTALVEHTLDLPGDQPTVVRMERADPADPGLADILVDIDLKSFVEATFSRYSAAALLHAAEVFLLKTGAQTVGACVCVRGWHVPHEALLLTMGILPGWRGRGLGQRYVGWVLDALSAEGFSGVSLLVGSENVRALRLYRDVGFEVVRELDTDPVSGERELLLRVALGSRLPA